MVLPLSTLQVVSARNCDDDVARLVAIVTGRPHAPTDTPDLLLEVARLNKVLLHPGLPVLPPPHQQQLEAYRLRCKTMIARGLVMARDVSTRLADAGIAHLHFKGPLLQYQIHGSVLRKPSADVDVLVHPDQRHAAARVLVDAGFTATEDALGGWWSGFLNERHYTHPDSDIFVDLHHGLQQAGLPQPRDIAGFLGRRATLAYFGTQFAVPSALDLPLILAINMIKAFVAHEPAGSTALDLHTLQSGLSPDAEDRLQAVARRTGLAETLELARILTAAALDQPAPRASPAWLPGPETLRAMVWQPWRADLVFPRRRYVLSWLCGNRPLQMVRELGTGGLSEAYLNILGWWNTARPGNGKVSR
ncbi:MAG: nucleotidyltransferase family protein [Rhodobacteraceae bacterium]|nr:nucleotidyltransferase family protein [Paracoccaceae bacterium]